MNYQRLFAIVGMGMLLSACAQYEPYRTPTFPVVSADSKNEEAEEWPPKCAVDEDLAKSSKLDLCEGKKATDSKVPEVFDAIQHRHYQAWSKRECAVDASQQKFGKPPLCDSNEQQRKRVTGDYHLSFVEFDDQGWFADRQQMVALFALLKRLEKVNDGNTLIYVYAHGWKHNASACDNNVVCFSRLLERTDLVEGIFEEYVTGDKRRNVVGVYLGWRGLPFDSVLNNLSFWSRKDTAARVGRGGVFELLTRLKDYRDIRQREKLADASNESKETIGTQLVITGHSFGGLVIYEALSHALMERAAKTKIIDVKDCTAKDCTAKDCKKVVYDVAESFGDFVMLVNPAFEGSLYEPLFHIATNRCYDGRQRPVMMIVTSEADGPTRIAFPIGRTLSTLFQHKKSSAQAESMRKTIGHNSRYQTHRLESDGKEPKEVGDETPCPCKYLEPTSNLAVTTDLRPLFETSLSHRISTAFEEPSLAEGETLLNPRPYGKEVKLVPVPGGECYIETDRAFQACMGSVIPDEEACKVKAGKDFQKCMAKPRQSSPKYASRYPYLVVRTDAGVIADHNAIYNERYLDFAMTFIDQHISHPKPNPWAWPQGDSAPTCTPAKGSLLPSEQSCWLVGGKSCSVPEVPVAPAP